MRVVAHVDIFFMCSWEEFYGFLLYHLNLTLGMILHMLVSPFKLVVASFLNIYLFLASPLGLCCCTWATSSSGEQGLIWLRCVGFSLWWFFLLQMSTKKRCTTWELQVKFYLGQNEDCSPGGGISDSSERLLQSSSEEKSIYNVLVKREFHEALTLQKIFC